jgi:crossover junction endodeoxyribonuclease RusA
MRESNPNTAPWRATVAAAALEAMGGRAQLAGPLELRALFVFARPSSHFGTGRNAGTLKSSAPAYRWTKPDLDKLLRAIGDALTGIVYRDDARITIVRAEKHYGNGPAFAHIVVSELEEQASSEP